VQSNPRLTPKEYYKSFLSLWGLFASVFAILPAASGFTAPGRIFPPLGDQTAAAQCFAILLGVATTYLMFHFKSAASSKIIATIVGLVLVSVFCFCLYFAAQARFVRVVPEAGRAPEIVSVGYERTDFANITFGASATDEDMLRARGLTDEDIRKLWTKKTLIVSRLLLFVSCMACTLSLVAVASLGVLLQAREGLSTEKMS
jgi:hypothetical protein